MIDESLNEPYLIANIGAWAKSTVTKSTKENVRNCTEILKKLLTFHSLIDWPHWISTIQPEEEEIQGWLPALALHQVLKLAITP